jgi:hypothetical protein
MRALLICHQNEDLNRIAFPRWLASVSNLVGVIILKETKQRKWRRIKREVKRVGVWRSLDVFAFRLYYATCLSAEDRAWEQKRVLELCQQYPEIPKSTPILRSISPNTPETEEFIRRAAPDIVIARCKTILKQEIFSLPAKGTFVMHPGICPEYRNAHGCFWALANRDFDHVGMSLLQIDKGVDTGPVYAYFTCNYDERKESHIVIQLRTVFDNLEAIGQKLAEIYEGRAVPLDTGGRQSAIWGQPWLSSYIKWKWEARKRRATCSEAHLNR